MSFGGPLWRMLALSGCAAAMSLAQSGGQATQTTAEMSQKDAPITFSTAVNLVLVPVVVRDANGRAIGTLKKEDFQLFDKGKPQEILRFSIEKAEAPPILPDTSIETDKDGNPQAKPDAPAGQPIAAHFVMWLFDDMHIAFGDLAQTREAAKKVLRDSFEPGTRAAIFTTSGRVQADFTDDRDKLDATLDKILPWPVAASPAAAECVNISYYQADALINRNDPQALTAAEAEYMTCNPPPPGASAQEVAALKAEADNIVRSMAMQEVNVGEHDTHVTLSTLNDLVRRMSTMPGSRAIVMVSPGFYLTIDHRTEESDLINRAIRANVFISSLDARGLYTLIPGGGADTPPGVSQVAERIKVQYQQESALANEDIMQELASATGGTFFHNSNDYAGGLKLLATQPEYIYVLGFAPQNLKFNGSYHTLKVVLKNAAGLQLQARRGYFERRHMEDAAEQAKEEIREAFFSRDEMRELPVELHTQFFKTGDFQAKLAILARVDIKHLHFRKADGRNDDTLTIVGGVFDRNGNYITGTQKTVDMKLKDQTLEGLPESGVTVKSSLDVPSGSYVVRLVVRDSEGQVMSALNSAVVIP